MKEEKRRGKVGRVGRRARGRGEGKWWSVAFRVTQDLQSSSPAD